MARLTCTMCNDPAPDDAKEDEWGLWFCKACMDYVYWAVGPWERK